MDFLMKIFGGAWFFMEDVWFNPTDHTKFIWFLAALGFFLFMLVISPYFRRKVSFFFSIHYEPSRMTSIVLGALLFIALGFGYWKICAERHAENEHDKLLPTLSQMYREAKDYVAPATAEELLEKGEREELAEVMVLLIPQDDTSYTKQLNTFGQRFAAFVTAERELPEAPENLFIKDTKASLQRLLIGVTLASFFALWFGMFMGAYRLCRAAVLPFMTFLSIIPPLCIMPIILVVFGVDELAKVAIIVIGTLFLMSRDIQNRAGEIPREQIVKSLTLGASSFAIVRRIIFPQILPKFFETVRIYLSPVWLFLIAGEMVAADTGLAYRIFLARRYMNMSLIIPVVLWVTLLGFAMNILLTLFVQWRYPWYVRDNERAWCVVLKRAVAWLTTPMKKFVKQQFIWAYDHAYDFIMRIGSRNEKLSIGRWGSFVNFCRTYLGIKYLRRFEAWIEKLEHSGEEPVKQTHFQTQHMIYVEDGQVRYDGRVILEDIDLAVSTGEFVTVVGPSGCGKSTLLRQILGAEKLTSGTLLVNGQRIEHPDRRRGIVYQSQANSLFPHLTALGNIRLGLEFTHGFFSRLRHRAEIEVEAQKLVDRVGLGEHAEKFPRQLSGGQQQRVGIAQALIMKPEVLLLDEPHASLDNFTKDALQDLLIELWQETRMTIFFVTHDFNEAVYLGTRVFGISQYYQEVDGTKANGARIVVDIDLGRKPKMRAVKATAEFGQTREFLARECFTPGVTRKVIDLALKHPDSFFTTEGTPST